MKEIQLTQGKVALVDDSDYEYLNQFKWHSIKTERKGYYVGRSVKVGKKYRNTSMHIKIMNTRKGMEVDHKDGNGLNNQKNNLRICNRTQNCQNRKKIKNCSSKYKCVGWHKGLNLWVAKLKSNGKSKHLGCFDTELEAAIIANIAMRKYHGEFARPNVLTPTK